MSSPVTYNLIDYSDSDSDQADIPTAASPQEQSEAPPSDANPPPRTLTLANSKWARRGDQKSYNNQSCLFSGTPSPQTMHNHIMRKKASKKYFSNTVMQPPFVPWSPLPSHQNMETRTCFHTGSRIHKLDCGHTITVPRDAEPCATNCKPPMCMISSTSSAVPAPYAASINLLRASTIRNVQSHIQCLAEAQDPLAEAKFTAHATILSQVWEAQDKTLTPPKDLISGDFSCALCGTEGPRATRPAAVVKGAPYHCVVVGNDECDVAIVKEIEKGVMPQVRDPFGRAAFNGNTRMQRRGAPLKRLGVGNDRGHRRSGAISMSRGGGGDPRKKRDAWQSAVRRKEKEGVLEKLREECLMEEMDGMGLEEW